jgi:hypothetical protein
MTYYDYTNKLTNQVTVKMHNTIKLYEKLKGSKGYLNEFDREIYKKAVEEYNSLADYVTKVQYSVLNERFNLLDEVLN